VSAPGKNSRATKDPNQIGGARASVKSMCKLHEETHNAIVQAVRAGNYLETAASYAGISKDTLYTWLKKGRAATKGPYREFVEAVDQAIASSEVRDLTLIGKAAEEQWQAAAWRLERRYPDRYGRRTRVDGDVNVNVQHVLDVSTLTDDELEELKRLLTKAQPQQEIGHTERAALELVAGSG